jgi:two-component system, cell cycle sensor histidine kinase and response regulator CckA
MKILIVEDDSDNRKILRYILENHGCDTIEAMDGREGLEMAEKHMPDFIVSDALMPGMDGFQFLRAIKQDEILKSIPLVFYSAVFTGHNDAELAISLGAEAFIIKPKEPEEFWEELNQIIEEYKMKTEKTLTAEIIKDETEYLRKHGEIINKKLTDKIEELKQEIVSRKKTENELAEAKKEWEEIYQAIGHPALILDPEYTILSANKAAAKALGSSPEELQGKKCYSCFHRSGAPAEGCPMSRLLESHSLETVDMEIEALGGIFLVSCTPVFDEKGSLKKVIHIATDITERKKAEEEKKRLESQLLQAQKMEAVGQLAGGIAHDFNNILTAIITYCSFLKIKMKKNDPLSMYVDNILNSSEKAASLIRNLLAFSRKQIIHLRPIDLNDIMKNVERILLRVLSEDIELKTEMTDRVITVMADPVQIEQVLMNLVTNARDAMPDGGTLTISTAVSAMRNDLAKIPGNGREVMYAVLSVKDTGAGMDEAVKGKIFEPFFTTKRMGKGTGLGLSMVYGIIKQHEGSIDVYSEPGKGTEFKIYLPIAPRTCKDSKTEDIALIKEGKETLLLAEDSQEVRASLSAILREFGYKVIEAADGEDMINKFKRHKNQVQLLILDMIMPKKNGKEAYEEIRKIKPEMQAIFVSGYTADIIHKKGIIEEGLEFILKPVSPILLMKKIREKLDRQKLESVKSSKASV